MRLFLLCIAALVSLPHVATGEPLSRERWELLGKIYREKPIRRHDMVSRCAANLLAKFAPELMKEIEEQYDMSGSRAAAQFCADYYEAIGDGSLKYEDIYGDEASPKLSRDD